MSAIYYSLPQPPYFLFIVGLLFGVTCGLAFEATLKQKAKEWLSKRSTAKLDELQDFELRFSFLGICAGICIFLASGLEIFSFDRWLAYGFSLFMTIFIGGLVWSQLGKVLKQLEEGGSKALDLDSW
jgi:hypothetical protein